MFLLFNVLHTVCSVVLVWKLEAEAEYWFVMVSPVGSCLDLFMYIYESA